MTDEGNGKKVTPQPVKMNVSCPGKTQECNLNDGNQNNRPQIVPQQRQVQVLEPGKGQPPAAAEARSNEDPTPMQIRAAIEKDRAMILSVGQINTLPGEITYAMKQGWAVTLPASNQDGDDEEEEDEEEDEDEEEEDEDEADQDKEKTAPADEKFVTVGVKSTSGCTLW